MVVRRKLIKYSCKSGYTLVGSRSSVCMNGRWNSKPPVCVATGCRAVVEISKLRITPTYDGAVLSFSCHESYSLEGARVVFCDGKRWSSKPPTCIPIGAESVCDFEQSLCGWTNSDEDHFNWVIGSGRTPTRYTGPSWDHTYGDGLKQGNYMFIETSKPRRPGHMAMLWSPIFPMTYAGKCFQFWYHMYGLRSVGSLSVIVKPRNRALSDQSPLFAQVGNHGNVWREGHVKIPFSIQQSEGFQIIIKAQRNDTVFSDIALDDVSIVTCPELVTTILVDTDLARTTASVQDNLSTTSTTNAEGISPGHLLVTETAASTTYSKSDSSTRETVTTAYIDPRIFAPESSSARPLSIATGDVIASSTKMTSSAAEEAPQRITERGRSRSAGRQETHLDHMTTEQTKDTAFITSAPSVARKSSPTVTAVGAITKGSDAKKSVSLTTQNIILDTPLVTDTTHETGGPQLTTDSEYGMQSTTHADVVRQQSGHALFRSLSITDIIVSDSEPTTPGHSTRQRNLMVPMTAASSSDAELDDERMSPAPLSAEDTVSSASIKTTLPALRYKHRQVTLDIPLMASLLVLAAFLSMTIGVVMWVIVKRRERANRYDQELTPIATAYSF